MKTWMMYVLLAIGLVWSVYWYAYLPCETILEWSWSLRDVPVRCIHL